MNNIKYTWKNINQILNRNKMNKEPPESCIEDNRNIVGNENIAKH